MNTETRTFNIGQIIFESNDSEVTLKGHINDGFLTYESDLIISFSQLNTVLNSLSMTNPDFSIDNYMQQQYMGNDEYMYEADLHGLNDNEIQLFDISYQSNIRQIRA